MKHDNLPLAVAASLVIGVAQWFVLTYAWIYITLHVQPIPWLIEHGFAGKTLLAIDFFFSTIVNLVLCLPAAFAILALRPKYVLTYLALAVVPCLLWQYRLFFIDPTLLSQWRLFILGLVSALLTLPLAVFVAHITLRRRAP